MFWKLLAVNALRPRRSQPIKRPRAFRPRVEQLEDRLALAVLPSGFTETLAAGTLSNPTAMELAPDGKLFIAEQAGTMEVWQNGAQVRPNFFVNTPITVNPSGERGLLGIAFDPNYATNRFMYVYYTATSPAVHNRISRFTVNATGDLALADSETVLMDLENLGATNHNGGAIHFGMDGKLYVAVGDNASSGNSQSVNNRLGKILRINPDPANVIPGDNPTSFPGITGSPTGVNRAIWAVGLRNPYTFAVQPGTGQIFINDVGEGTWEEINRGAAGANYGWPTTEGMFNPASFPNFTNPVLAYPHGSGNAAGIAISGGAFYNPAANQFPPDYAGDYFYAEFGNAWIRRYDAGSNTSTLFASNSNNTLSGMVDLKVASDGSLYYLSRGTGGNTGSVYRVQFPQTVNSPPNLAPISDQSVPPNQDILTVTLSATDPNGDPITYSASAQSQAYVLDQQLGLFTNGNLYENWGGKNDKWMLGNGNEWYFILPSGDLYRWDGSSQATGTLVGSPGSSYHANPSLLFDALAGQPHAALSLSNNVLTIDRENGFIGAIVVTATASDGQLSDSESFTITVGNRPPVLTPIANRTIPSTQDTLSVSLSASDPDGSPVTLSVTAESLAYVLDQQLGLTTTGNLFLNWGGRNEKWVLGNGNQWYFILPNGELYRWDGSSQSTGTLVGTPGASYHTSPELLYNAIQGQPRAAFNIAGNTLSIDRDNGWISSIVFTVTASDGMLTDSEMFTVTVTS